MEYRQNTNHSKIIAGGGDGNSHEAKSERAKERNRYDDGTFAPESDGNVGKAKGEEGGTDSKGGGKEDAPEVVELDENSELARRVEGLYENKRYKVIMEYLRETIGNEEIKFHDGITAKMDGGDAKKIARDAYHKGSGLRRTAELSVVQQLIENARYKKTVARDHDKFSSCRYYAVTTRYKGVEDRLLLNVGKNKFTGAYHFHAITHDEEK